MSDALRPPGGVHRLPRPAPAPTAGHAAERTPIASLCFLLARSPEARCGSGSRGFVDSLATRCGLRWSTNVCAVGPPHRHQDGLRVHISPGPVATPDLARDDREADGQFGTPVGGVQPRLTEEPERIIAVSPQVLGQPLVAPAPNRLSKQRVTLPCDGPPCFLSSTTAAWASGPN